MVQSLCQWALRLHLSLSLLFCQLTQFPPHCDFPLQRNESRTKLRIVLALIVVLFFRRGKTYLPLADKSNVKGCEQTRREYLHCESGGKALAILKQINMRRLSMLVFIVPPLLHADALRGNRGRVLDSHQVDPATGEKGHTRWQNNDSISVFKPNDVNKNIPLKAGNSAIEPLFQSTVRAYLPLKSLTTSLC